MKDYNRIAQKVGKMASFCDIYNCGCPTEHNPVNLYFQMCEPYIIGIGFYVSYDWGEGSVDYTLNPDIKMRSDMERVRGIKTEQEMYAIVSSVIEQIRNSVKNKSKGE